MTPLLLVGWLRQQFRKYTLTGCISMLIYFNTIGSYALRTRRIDNNPLHSTTTENSSVLQSLPIYEHDRQISQNRVSGEQGSQRKIDIRQAISSNILRIPPPPIEDADICQLIRSDCAEMQAIRKSYFQLAVAHVAYTQFQDADEGCLTRMTLLFDEKMFDQVTEHFQMEVKFFDYLYGLMRYGGEEQAINYLGQVIKVALNTTMEGGQRRFRNG
jgi:hypothetical protein